MNNNGSIIWVSQQGAGGSGNPSGTFSIGQGGGGSGSIQVL